jgi:hypothetical protein
MISKLHARLGTAGFIISIVALVAALGGGAYAASGGLNSKQKKEVEKIAKKVAKPGPPGQAGPKGDTGAAGSNGTNGTDGKNGADGSNGAAGANGKSVKVANEEPAHCPGERGVTYEVEGSGTLNEVCDGETGFTKTLPSGETETGSWATPELGVGPDFAGSFNLPISFTIPLAGELGSAEVHFLKEGEINQTGCPGSAAAPQASPGNLCIYTTVAREVENNPVTVANPAIVKSGIVNAPSNPNLIPGASPVGSILILSLPEASYAYGTWAVTAG